MRHAKHFALFRCVNTVLGTWTKLPLKAITKVFFLLHVVNLSVALVGVHVYVLSIKKFN